MPLLEPKDIEEKPEENSSDSDELSLLVLEGGGASPGPNDSSKAIICRLKASSLSTYELSLAKLAPCQGNPSTVGRIFPASASS